MLTSEEDTRKVPASYAHVRSLRSKISVRTALHFKKCPLTSAHSASRTVKKDATTA